MPAKHWFRQARSYKGNYGWEMFSSPTLLFVCYSIEYSGKGGENIAKGCNNRRRSRGTYGGRGGGG